MLCSLGACCACASERTESGTCIVSRAHRKPESHGSYNARGLQTQTVSAAVGGNRQTACTKVRQVVTMRAACAASWCCQYCALSAIIHVGILAPRTGAESSCGKQPTEVTWGPTWLSSPLPARGHVASKGSWRTLQNRPFRRVRSLQNRRFCRATKLDTFDKFVVENGFVGCQVRPRCYSTTWSTSVAWKCPSPRGPRTTAFPPSSTPSAADFGLPHCP